MEVTRHGKAIEVKAKIDFNHKYVKSAVVLTALYMVTKFGYHQMVRYQKRSKANRQRDAKVRQLRSTKHECLELYDSTIRAETASLILSLSATAIRQHIIDGKLSCSEVMLTLCHRTNQCNAKLNAILEAHYDAAYRDAVALDREIAEYRSKDKASWTAFVDSKPMLGIPLSIKDLFAMKGSDCTLGIRRKCDDPYPADGKVVEWVRECGGIPFVKTNVPQLNMLPETINSIIGHCNNPYHLGRVVGGSSGGEGALIAAGCSKLGIGTDIGGSIRSPAHFSGCIGYKPSTSRCPQTGKGLLHRDSFVSKFAIRAAMGPMASDMDDIILFLKSMWSPSTARMFQLDPYMMPMPFRDEIFESKTKLTIGYWFDDGWFSSTQSVKRAIKETVDLLSSEYEYDVVEIPYSKANDTVNAKHMLALYYKYISAEGPMAGFVDALQDTEPLDAGFLKTKRLGELPMCFRRWLFEPILKAMGEPRKRELLRMTTNKELTVREHRKGLYEIMKFKYDFWSWMDQFGVDVVITPTDFYPAPPHEFSPEFLSSLTGRFLQNVLDCAAGNYGPVTFVKREECHYDVDALPELERDGASKLLNEFMKDAEGLPVGVQLFGKPFDDEKVLRVMNDLDRYFKKNGLKNRGKMVI